MAHACARIWASEGATFFLIGRNWEKLTANAQDLQVRGAKAVTCHILDMENFDRYDIAVETAFSSLGPIDLAFIAHGVFAQQEACSQDPDMTQKLFTLNATAIITFLTHLAPKMASQGSGTIAVITSVAGDRGRPGNYVYGAGKAALSTFCEGLQAVLFKHGVHVTLIKPGFVATPMTENMKLPPMLVSSPERVASLIVCGIKHKKNTLYVPQFWWWIMTIIRLIPTPLFKRMEI